MTITEQLTDMLSEKRTENGAIAWTTTHFAIIDMFASIGGKRSASKEEIENIYLAARAEDADLADKMIFYCRDILGGLGERRIGRILLHKLACIDPDKMKRNFDLIAKYGRWDDFYCLEYTPCELDMWDYLYGQFIFDYMEYTLHTGNVSLLAKWLKSENASSAEARRLARKFCQINNISYKKYRKILSELRKYINVIETKISKNEWNTIEYSTIPSIAHHKYSSAFAKHDRERYTEYLEKLKSNSPEVKINAKTITPATIISNISNPAAEAQWNALPNYFTGNKNIICCADVSGSMRYSGCCSGTQPIDNSIGLAMYCAMHNNGIYKNKYLTFTDKPTLIEYDSKRDLAYNVGRAKTHIGYNTNLDGMFEAIYEAASAAHRSPEGLVIVSDMEIDSFLAENKTDGIVDKWSKKFHAAELAFFPVVFWNVDARNDFTILNKIKNPYVKYVSGNSPTIFSNLETIMDKSQYDAIVEILNKYEVV